MPSFPWLFENELNGEDTAAKMASMNIVVGATCPTCDLYSDADMKAAQSQVAGKTEADALIAYLQGLGTAIKR